MALYTQKRRNRFYEWVAACNNRDPFALIELCPDDAQVDQLTFCHQTLSGRDVLLASAVDFFRAFPDNYTNPENIFEDGEWVIIEWSGGGTFTSSLGEMLQTGKNFKLCGYGFFHIVDGRIRF
ncbi:MAG: ester cyclase [Pyrinomonadaceae bacterium]